MTSHHPILIAGGGLGGLVLARVLHVHGIDAPVLELDSSPQARGQGSMLDMHEESGQAALRAAGLYEEFRAAVHEGGQAMRILDRHGEVGLDEPDDGEGTRPEINRDELRDILLGSLPDGLIHWGAKLTGARPLGGGRHEVTLADGRVLTTDLLIGADGAWSKIRPLVSSARPEYTGVSFVEFDLSGVRYPDSAELVGGGMLFALGEGKGFLAHREKRGRLHVYVAVAAPEDWLDGVAFSDVEVAKAEVLAVFHGWADELRELVVRADGPLVPRPVHALPVGHRWDRVAGVTLLGDAAHLMSPFAGEGANLAMLDGAELAAAIVENPDDREKALSRYEDALFPRGEAAAAESADNLVLMFRADAPQGLIAEMAGFQAPGA